MLRAIYLIDGEREGRVQVDCFSYGVVLWEIVTKEQTQRGNWRSVLVPDECPADVEELIQASIASSQYTYTKLLMLADLNLN